MGTKRILFKSLGVIMALAMMMVVLPAGEVMATSATMYVRTGGNDSCDGLTDADYADGVTACAFATIQAAIDAASPGDTIMVAEGTYNLTELIQVNKSVSIIGSTTGITKVVGVGGDDMIVFQITADDVILQNLTITLLRFKY